MQKTVLVTVLLMTFMLSVLVFARPVCIGWDTYFYAGSRFGYIRELNLDIEFGDE